MQVEHLQQGQKLLALCEFRCQKFRQISLPKSQNELHFLLLLLTSRSSQLRQLCLLKNSKLPQHHLEKLYNKYGKSLVNVQGRVPNIIDSNKINRLEILQIHFLQIGSNPDSKSFQPSIVQSIVDTAAHAEPHTKFLYLASHWYSISHGSLHSSGRSESQ